LKVLDFLYNLFYKVKKLIKNKEKNKKIKNDTINDNNYILEYNSNTNIILDDNDDSDNNNIIFDIYGFIKCKNYDICKSILPKYWYEYNGEYLCYSCDCLFGKWRGGKGILTKFDRIKCPICLEYKKGFSHPRCEHYLCIDCIRRCYYGEKNNEPIFPYPDEIKINYELDPYNNKWDINYPLIKEYIKEHNEWYDKKIIKYKKEKYLRKCHLCRK
jgi:hypothetical protein